MPAKSGEAPPFPVFVAESSSNLHRDWKRWSHFVRSAEGIGCGAVKFQLLRIRELFAVEAPGSNSKFLKREAWELPVSFLADLSAATYAAACRFPAHRSICKEMFPHVVFYKICVA